jgi:hypothetical protein
VPWPGSGTPSASIPAVRRVPVDDEDVATVLSGTLVAMPVLPRRRHYAQHAGRRPGRPTRTRVGTSIIGPLVAVLVVAAAFGAVGGGSGVMRALGLAQSRTVGESSSAASVGPTRPPAGALAPSPDRGGPRSAVRWRAVLYRLDSARARAWRRGDPDLLRAVYTAQSPALDDDRHLLGDYARRGMRVRDVRLRFGRVAVVERRPGYVRLAVVDRLAAATAVSASGRLLPLPRDRPSRHRVLLRRVGEGWRIDRVRAV